MKKYSKIVLFAIILIFTIFNLSSCAMGVAFSITFMVDDEVYYTLDTKGNNMVELPDDPEKEGYEFEGWYWDKGTWKIPFTATSLLTIPLSDKMTVYAKWDSDVPSYTISFEFNCGDVMYEVKAKQGERIWAPWDSHTYPEGVYFEGWFIDNGTFEQEFIVDIMPSQNLTVYAKWYWGEEIPISCLSDFQNIIAYKNYYLINNIDLDGIEWEPISWFHGNFDGNGYIISNFKITAEQQDIGFFGGNTGGIKNLGLIDFYIDVTHSSTISVGGLVGFNCGIITGCYATGDVRTTINGDGYLNAYVGGLAGQSYEGIITDCYATGDVSATINGDDYSTANVGGLVGESFEGIITDCYATGNISSESSIGFIYAGGVVGYNVDGIITNSYSLGDISVTCSGSAEIGVLVGHNYKGTVMDCYVIGNVNVTTTTSGDQAYSCASAGGMVGSNHGTITGCYAIGDVNATITTSGDQAYSCARAGGMVGLNHGTIIGCYAIGDVNTTITTSGDHAQAYVDAGALLGSNHNTSTATSCYAIGDVNATITTSGDYAYASAIAGGLVGYISEENTIRSCYAIGDVSVTTSSDDYSEAYAGGLIGYNYGAITDCYATGNVNTTTNGDGYSATHAGGLVGINWGGTIIGCYAIGDVDAISSLDVYSGGFVGYNFAGTITSCYATGDVSAIGSADVNVGGLVGSNSDIITNCYTTGNVDATISIDDEYSFNAGGLVGSNYSSGTITGCYATGDVSTTVNSDDYLNAYAGGVVGVNEGTVESCYHYEGQSFYIIISNNESDEPTNTEGTATSLENLQSREWIIENLWCCYDAELWLFNESNFPVLKENLIEILNTVIEINNFNTLLKLSGCASIRSYILTDNINLNEIEWTPISCLSGNFDGSDFIISNFKITAEQQHIGFFGYNTGEIKNLGLTDFYINVTYSSTICVGGLVGYNAGIILDCYATGDVSVEGYYVYVGVLVGKNSGTITGCYAAGDISMIGYYAYVGGLVGDNLSTITGCYAVVDVSMVGYYAYGGGLVGRNWRGLITNCYSIGDVNANGYYNVYAGGLVGSNGNGFYNGAITNCYAIGNVSVIASGSSYSIYALAGGLVGDNEGRVEKCYRYKGQSFCIIINDNESYEPTNKIGTASSLKNLQSEAWIKTNLGWGEYISLADLEDNPGNVWVFGIDIFPMLYWQE